MGSTSVFPDPCETLERFASWRGKPTPARSWRRVWKKASWIRLLSGLTSPPSTVSRGVDSLIASLEASRVRTSVTQESAQGSKSELVPVSGTSTLGSFTKWDRDSSSWKMSASSSGEDLTSFSGIWPRWGTMRSGVCSARPKPERHTVGNASLSSPSSEKRWPTPIVNDYLGSTHCYGPKVETGERLRYLKLPGAAPAWWPTPDASVSTGYNQSGTPGSSIRPTLAAAASTWPEKKTWPTPQAHDHASPKTPEQIEAMKARGREKGRTPGVWNLNEVAVNDFTSPSLPAPMTENDGPSTSKSSRLLNPLFVEALMGWPIGWTACEHAVTESFQTKPLTLSPYSPSVSSGPLSGPPEIRNVGCREEEPTNWNAIVLWIVGEPGVGKTTAARKILADYGRPKIEHARPKWTEFTNGLFCGSHDEANGDPKLAITSAAAVGTWRGDPFDGGDTVPIGDIKPALAYYADHFVNVPLVLFDGDKFANANAVEYVRACSDINYKTGAVSPQLVCLHLVGPEEAAEGRAKRSETTGKVQNAAWVTGRRTKSARFAKDFPGLVVTVSREDLRALAAVAENPI